MNKLNRRLKALEANCSSRPKPVIDLSELPGTVAERARKIASGLHGGTLSVESMSLDDLRFVVGLPKAYEAAE